MEQVSCHEACPSLPQKPVMAECLWESIFAAFPNFVADEANERSVNLVLRPVDLVLQELANVHRTAHSKVTVHTQRNFLESALASKATEFQKKFCTHQQNLLMKQVLAVNMPLVAVARLAIQGFPSIL